MNLTCAPVLVAVDCKKARQAALALPGIVEELASCLPCLDQSLNSHKILSLDAVDLD